MAPNRDATNIYRAKQHCRPNAGTLVSAYDVRAAGSAGDAANQG